MLRVHTIFKSVSGEVGPFPQGTPVLFIRLHGCNLKCPYCDATEACVPAEKTTVVNYEPEELARLVKNESGISGIVITGGEPLLQAVELDLFLLALIDADSHTLPVGIETNGTIVPKKWYPHVTYIFDYKDVAIHDNNATQLDAIIEVLPQIGMHKYPHKHYLKILTGTEDQLDMALYIARRYHVYFKAIAISPIDKITYKRVYDEILLSNVPITLNCQAHKLMLLDEKEQ